MLHADSFNLGDSMSALELMDPKMDAGVTCEKNKSVVAAGEPSIFVAGLAPFWRGDGTGWLSCA